MLLSHARVMAHAEIYQTSAASVTYQKAADVPNQDADDWEPVPKIHEPPAAPPEDCGCGEPTPPE